MHFYLCNCTWTVFIFIFFSTARVSVLILSIIVSMYFRYNYYLFKIICHCSVFSSFYLQQLLRYPAYVIAICCKYLYSS